MLGFPRLVDGSRDKHALPLKLLGNAICLAFGIVRRAETLEHFTVHEVLMGLLNLQQRFFPFPS